MSELSQLSPQLLWHTFDKICSIPHISCYENQLSEYIISWAKREGLYVECDNIGNILIRKLATNGMENRKLVALQAHLDMVPQKSNNVIHDFTKDFIKPYINGNWVKAYGTTLGADNGIGLASILTVLADKNIEHGPLEILLTTKEEIGMEGASNLRSDWLQAEIMINTDSETEGEIYIGCAGGISFIFSLPLTRNEIQITNFQFFKLILKGLRGGHSGIDIHLELGNANKLLARFLANYAVKLNLQLIDFNGGNICNAIPHEAFAIIAVTKNKIKNLKTSIRIYLDTLKNEFMDKEKNLDITIVEIPFSDKTALTIKSRDTFIQLLNVMPNDIIRNSNIAKDIVETSVNVGIVTTKYDNAEIVCLVRSLIESGKNYVLSMLESLSKLAGARTVMRNNYPSWKPDINSPMIKLVKKIYQRLFKNEPNIKIIHAGLECGLIKKLYPRMDIVSIGPTIINPHSINEQVNIESVNNYWILLTEILKEVPIV